MNLSEKVPQAFAEETKEEGAPEGEAEVVVVEASPIAPAHQP